PRIGDVDLAHLASLAAEPEGDAGPVDLDVALAHGRQPEGLVLARVLVVPDADARLVEQADDRRHDAGLAQRAPRHVPVDLPPDPRKRLAEGDHAAVLDLVPHRAPARVVAVLLAPASVPAGGLEVPVRRRA